jgi:hypothetical protein
MNRTISLVITFLLVVYPLSYLAFRSQHTESREEGPKMYCYLIFPKDKAWIYDLYRPMTYADERLTGMRFHVGPLEPNLLQPAATVMPSPNDDRSD